MGTSGGIVTGIETQDTAICLALTLGEDSSDTLHRLYRLRKASNRRISLQFLCRSAGIPSTGYLSDVLRGRRCLHLKYAASLPAAMGLSPAQARIVRTQVALDHERDPLAARRLRRRLGRLRKGLAAESGPMPAPLASTLFAFEVFAAFGLYGNVPRLADLVRHFGARRQKEIDRALRILAGAGMVAHDGERYRILKSQFLFTGVAGDQSQLAYTQSVLEDARRRAPKWFHDRGRALFQASTISVNRCRYQALLPKIRELFLETQSELECGEANMLVRLSVQAFPVE